MLPVLLLLLLLPPPRPSDLPEATAMLRDLQRSLLTQVRIVYTIPVQYDLDVLITPSESLQKLFELLRNFVARLTSSEFIKFINIRMYVRHGTYFLMITNYRLALIGFFRFPATSFIGQEGERKRRYVCLNS
jgi:hypothetical protein